MLLLRFALLLFLPLGLGAQIRTPPASAPTTVIQQIGLTNFRLKYHRPNVQGRAVFGELVPWNEVWRTGANETTTLHFDRPVGFGTDTIAAGTYGLYTIPGEQTWTWILSRDTALWGARGYNEQRDVLRLTTPAEPLRQRTESMELHWMNIDHQRAELVLDWEYTRVRLPLTVATNAQVAHELAGLADGRASGDEYYRAARYYLDNGLDLTQARRWMERKVALDGEQFGILRYQALIEHGLGDTVAARRTLLRSLELARRAPNEHYVRLNEQTLRQWTRTPVAISGEAVVERSINYHDPTGAWATGRHSLTLYEDRPTASTYRITRLTFDHPAGSFTLDQQRDRDHIYRFSSADSCVVRINGADKPFVEAMDINLLRCQDNERIRNYYTYLWGLPMKLQDDGTRIHPRVYLRDFYGQQLLEVGVSYSPETGSDVWYFYFDPTTYALRGYRFYHDEARNDGEYVLLRDEVELGPLRLPARREWYSNAEREYLGVDEVLD